MRPQLKEGESYLEMSVGRIRELKIPEAEDTLWAAMHNLHDSVSCLSISQETELKNRVQAVLRELHSIAAEVNGLPEVIN